MKIETHVLKSMVSKAVKGASNNAMLPLTQLMAVELKDNVLTLATTDMTNYLFVKQDKIVGDDFYVTVPVDLFTKLVNKITSENIELTLTPGILVVKGNGSYSIELTLDENGDIIYFPDVLESVSKDEKMNLELTTVLQAIKSVKPALATTQELPCYCNYYTDGNIILGTDTYKISQIDVPFTDEPMLVAPNVMDLIGIMTKENIAVYKQGDIVVYETDDITLYTREPEGLDEYAVDAISGLIGQEFPSSCSVDKSDLLSVLDRISLFVGVYDKGAIKLTFTKEGLVVTSNASTGSELLDFKLSDRFKDFSCSIDAQMLTTMVKAQEGDLVALDFGEDNAVKLVDETFTAIVALLEEE